MLYVLEVQKTACVGELVYVDDPVVGILLYEQSDHVRADEAGPTGDGYGALCHIPEFLSSISLSRYWPYWLRIIGWASWRSFSLSIQP